MKGRDLFDASLFRHPTSTAVFYTFIAQLKESIDKATPTPTHQFIKTLDSKHKLLRSYTQNIDGLEERVGLLGTGSPDAKATSKGKSKLRSKDVRNVQLHGDVHRVRCTFCSAEFRCEAEHLKAFNEGVPPDCPDCATRCTQIPIFCAFSAPADAALFPQQKCAKRDLRALSRSAPSVLLSSCTMSRIR